jgi:hypothetical protein
MTNLKDILAQLTPQAVADMVVADPDLWSGTVLPAIAKGVFQAAEWFIWHRADGIGIAAELTNELWLEANLQRLERKRAQAIDQRS